MQIEILREINCSLVLATDTEGLCQAVNVTNLLDQHYTGCLEGMETVYKNLTKVCLKTFIALIIKLDNFFNI